MGKNTLSITMNKIISIRKLFTTWQDEQEEKWLEKMALDGLLFKSVTKYGLYSFEKNHQKKVSYVIEYIKDINSLDEFIKDHSKDNWIYVTNIGNWVYFSKEYSEQCPVKNIDIDAKIDKMNKTLGYYGICTIFISQINFIINLLFDEIGAPLNDYVHGIIIGLAIGIILILVYMCSALLGRINQLKKIKNMRFTR